MASEAVKLIEGTMWTKVNIRDACEKGQIFLNLTVPLGFISHGNVQVSVRPRVFGGDEGDAHLHGLHLQRHVAQGEAQALQVTGKINSKLLSSIFD